jgi:hypothetical protein
MKLASILMILWIIASCNTNQQLADNPFEKYYSQINQPEYPILFDCYSDSVFDKYCDDDTVKSKYNPQGCCTFGRLTIHDSVISIIYLMAADFYYPTIFTYKPDGSPVDTLCLYSGASCDGFPEQWSHSAARIDKNNTITMIDTLGIYQIDSVANIIEGSDSIIISICKYKLEKTGFFNKIYENKLARPGYGEHIDKFFN